MSIDTRLLRIGIEVRGQLRTYEDLAITATGIKYANPNQAECNVTIANLSKDVTNYILTETSPLNRNRTPKLITVEAGRASTGYSLLYKGNIFRSQISQPPDAVLSLRALSGQFQKGVVVTRSAGPSSPLSSIAQQVAEDLGLTLTFQATDKQIANYSFSGSATKQVAKLSQLASVDVFIDNDFLIVKDRSRPLIGKVRRLDADTGMIGVPTFTEVGAKITMLYDSQTVIGGQLDVTSRQSPALTGKYVIYKLPYMLTNRETPFYLTAECRRIK